MHALDRPTRLVLLGRPVSHSLSPIFQNAALKSAGLSATYDALDVTPDALPGVLRDLARGGVAGNVTVPHKGAVAKLCSQCTEVAARTGAVNTFWHDKGKLIGDNTDVIGARVAITNLLDTSPALSAAALTVAVLGAGGAAAAVLLALENFPVAAITVWSRNVERARELARHAAIDVTVVERASEAVRDATLVINCTPIGLSGTEVPVSVEFLRADARIFDLVPRAGQTEWTRLCRERGHLVEDGTRMLIEQGAAAFERWFGLVPDRAAMWRSLKGRIEQPGASRASGGTP